jgi:uncharacterized membrane protein HdeD (DUF308 family)
MTDNVSSTAPGDPLEESAEELTEPLVELSAGPWWWVLIRGLLAVAFGVIALFSPGIAAIAIAFVFGAYAVVDGITEIAHAVRIRKTDKRWGWLLFAGIVSVIAGALALLLPVLAAFLGLLIVLWTIVFYNVVHGAMVIGSASGATGKSGRGWAIFAGVVSIVFGVVLAVLLDHAGCRASRSRLRHRHLCDRLRHHACRVRDHRACPRQEGGHGAVRLIGRVIPTLQRGVGFGRHPVRHSVVVRSLIRRAASSRSRWARKSGNVKAKAVSPAPTT